MNPSANKHTGKLRVFDADSLPRFTTDGLKPHGRKVADTTLAEHRTHACQPKQRRTLDLRHLANIAAALPSLPEDGHTWHIIAKGNTPFWQCIPRMIELAAEPIRELKISTLGFGRDFSEYLLDALDSHQIANFGIVSSHYHKCTSQGEYHLLAEKLTSEQLAIARCHAKVIAATMQSGRGFTFEGSGNLRSCASIEHMNVTQDAALARFHQAWITDLLTTHGQTTNAIS